VFGLSLHGAVGLPMVATMFDGNTSDKFMNAFHIESLAALLPDEDEVTLVADSKLVDTQLIGTLLDQEMHFISLVPHTFGARGAALALLATDGKEHPELGRTPARKKSKPDTVYSGRSYDLDFVVHRPGADATELTKLRFLAVHSEALAAKFEASLPRKLAKEVASVKSAFDKANKKPFSCEKDAQKVLDKLLSRPKLHTATGAVERFEVPGKRQRGRPRTDAVKPQAQERFRLVLGDCVVNEAEIEVLRRSKSHLVLITDHLDRETRTDADILAEYRHQYIVEGHTGFRWFKGPTQMGAAPLIRQITLPREGKVPMA
jgi:transposase